MAFVVLYPILLILANSVTVREPDGTARVALEAWSRAFAQPGLGDSILNTFRVVVAVQAISFPIAVVTGVVS